MTRADTRRALKKLIMEGLMAVMAGDGDGLAQYLEKQADLLDRAFPGRADLQDEFVDRMLVEIKGSISAEGRA